MRLGTIHSHAGIDAFHSFRDSQDERFERRLPPHYRQFGHRPHPVVLRGGPGARGPIPRNTSSPPYPIPWDQAPPESEWTAEVDLKVTPLLPPIEFGP